MARPRNANLPDLNIPAELRPGIAKGDQIREIIETLALQLDPGEPIPSDRAFADHFGVARMTVRQEVRRLAADGVLDMRPGSGTYAAENRRLSRPVGVSFSHDMRNRGMVPGATILEHDVLEATGRVATALAVSRGARVLRIVRLRTADGEPMGLERSTVPLERFPGLEDVDLSTASLYDTLRERWGVEPKKVASTASALLPAKEEAKLLGIAESEPCMAVVSVQRDAQEKVIETGRSIYRGDRYDVDVSYERAT